MNHFGWQKKKTPRATVSPTVRDLEWAAGFIEGEGSFDKAGTSARIMVKQVNEEPLLRLQTLFGGSVYPYRYSEYPINIWTSYGARARGIMMTLYTLLSSRRRAQIRRALGAG